MCCTPSTKKTCGSGGSTDLRGRTNRGPVDKGSAYLQLPQPQEDSRRLLVPAVLVRPERGRPRSRPQAIAVLFSGRAPDCRTAYAEDDPSACLLVLLWALGFLFVQRDDGSIGYGNPHLRMALPSAVAVPHVLDIRSIPGTLQREAKAVRGRRSRGDSRKGRSQDRLAQPNAAVRAGRF